MRLLEHDYATQWTVEALASAVDLSSAELQGHFRRELRQSIAQYLNEIRVREAGELLIGGCSVTEAARKCGFPSSATLSYYFFRSTGIHASNYRFKMVGWKYGAAALERRTTAGR